MSDIGERLLLGRLKEKILRTMKRLKKGQVLLKNKLKLAYQQLAYYLKESSIEITNPDLHYEDIIQEVPESSSENEEIIEHNLKIIQNDLFANMQLIPTRRRYTMLTKIFSYCIYIKSKDAYNFLRLAVPLPCETILHETFGHQIDNIENQLSDIKKIDDILNEQAQFINEEQIEVVLSVDAFSTTVLMKNDGNEDKNTNKNMFIYLLIPLKCQYKPIILHLESAPSGAANSNVYQNIEYIYNKLSGSKFHMKYCSCDGDSYYSKYFHNQLNEILQIFESADSDDIKKYFENKHYIWLTDPLHILKNARSRIINCKALINPEIPGNYISAESLNEILDLGPVLLDRSSIGKLRDIYPVTLFTINNSMKVLFNDQIDCFFYLFVYSLWNEALLNPHFAPITRFNLYSLCLELFICIYRSYKDIQLPDNVAFKKSQNKDFVTMITIEKLERIIASLIMTVKEVERNDENLRLAGLGSHITEQQIGQIRSWCHFDHRSEVVIHATACHYFVKTNAKHIFPDVIAKNRLNSGGCKLFEGKYIHEFKYSIKDMATILMSTFTKKPCNSSIFNEVIQDFIELVNNAPFESASLPSQTANMTILNRYLIKPSCVTYDPIQYSKKKWSSQDDYIISQCLLCHQEESIFSLFKTERSDNAIRTRINLKKKELEERPWQMHEYTMMDILVQWHMPPKDCLGYFTCRSLKDIEKIYHIRYIYQRNCGFLS